MEINSQYTYYKIAKINIIRSAVKPTGVDGTCDVRAARTPLVNLDQILTQESFAFLSLFNVLKTM